MVLFGVKLTTDEANNIRQYREGLDATEATGHEQKAAGEVTTVSERVFFA